MSSFFILSTSQTKTCEDKEKMGNNNVDISVRALDQASHSLANIAQALRNLETATGGVSKAAGAASPAFGEMSMGMSAAIAIGNMASVAIMAVSAAIASIPQRAIAATAMMQGMETGLIGLMAREAALTSTTGELADVMPQAAERAKGMVEELAKLAIVSPYQVQNVTNTYRQAMAFGYASDEALDFTKALLNVAAGVGANNEVLERMGYNLAQIRMVGKVTAVDFRQLAMAGFDLNAVLVYMGKQFGYTIKDYKDFNTLIEQGKLTWADFTKSFAAYAESQFGGASDRMARTLMGLQSTFNDLFTLTAPKVMMKSVELVTDELNSMLNSFLKIRDSGVLEEWGEKFASATRTAIRNVKDFVENLKVIADIGGKAFAWVKDNIVLIEALGKAFLFLKSVDVAIGVVLGLQQAFASLNITQAITRGLLPNIATQLGGITTATAAHTTAIGVQTTAIGVQTKAIQSQMGALIELAIAQKATMLSGASGTPFFVAGKGAIPSGPTVQPAMVGGAAAGAAVAGGGILAAISSIALLGTAALLAAQMLMIAKDAWEKTKTESDVGMKELGDAMRAQSIELIGAVVGEELQVRQKELAARVEYNQYLLKTFKDVPMFLDPLKGAVADLDAKIRALTIDEFIAKMKSGVDPLLYAQSALQTATYGVIGGFEGLVTALPGVLAAFGDAGARWRPYELGMVPFGDAGARWKGAEPSDMARVAAQYSYLKDALDFANQIAAAGSKEPVIPPGMTEGMWKTQQDSLASLKEISAVQAWLKANPGDKVQQEYLKKLLGLVEKGYTLTGNLVTAFPTPEAARAWQGAFKQQQGREAGPADVRTLMAIQEFIRRENRPPSDEEYQARWKTGSFKGMEDFEKVLDGIYGPSGTYKDIVIAQLATQKKNDEELWDAFALKTLTTTTSFKEPQAVKVINFPAGGGGLGAGAAGYGQTLPGGAAETWSDDPNDDRFEISNLGNRRRKKLAAYGDFFSRATNVIVGEAGPEVVLPLSKPDRARQLLTQAIQYAPSIAMGLPMPMAEGGITTAIPIGQKAIATDKSVLQSIRDTATKTIERIIGKDTTIKDNRFVERLVRDVTPTLIAQVAIPHLAQGDFFNQAVNVIVGENGPEVIIPLSKPERAGQLLQQSISISPSFERVMMAVMAAKMQPVIPRMAEGGIIQALPIPRMAKGGIVRNPMFAWLAQQERQKMTNMGLQVTAQGEVGPEVIRPLSKPERASQLLGQAIQYVPSITKGLPMPPIKPERTERLLSQTVQYIPRIAESVSPLARMGGMGVDVTPRMLPLARMGGMGVDVTPRMLPLASQIAMTPPPRMGQGGASYLPLRSAPSIPGFPVAQNRMVGLPMPMAQGGMMGGPTTGSGAMPLRLSAPSPVSVTIAGGTFLGTEAEAQAFARKIKKYLDREGARTL